jgi:dipeptidyl aminopeptidase/acylaminoacyl peptidase
LLRKGAAVDLSGALSGDLVRLADGSVAATLTDHSSNRRLIVTTAGHALRTVSAPPSATTLTSLGGAKARAYYVEQASDATRILVEGDEGQLSQTNFVLNRHFAEVRVPQRREVEYAGRDGDARKAVLYYPTDGRPLKGLRVVVMIYPDSTPRLQGSMGRPNSSGSYQSQPFLSAGFAYLHAPFPVKETTIGNEPLKLPAQAVLPALEALDLLPEVAKGRYGFFGHSNGGFAGLAIGTQTDRFKAIVSSAPFPDIFDVDLAVTSEIYQLDCAPGVVQARRFYYEGPRTPYQVGDSIVEDPQGFIRNSALYNLERYRTPTLITYGQHDVSLSAAQKTFLSLQAAGVDAELDTYWGESHIIQSPENIRHSIGRQIAWFDRYL